MNFKTLATTLFTIIFVAACGGGGGTVSSTPPASTPTTDPTSRFEDSKFGSSTFN